jgi:hypothetical protein
MLTALSGTDWGWSGDLLRKVYRTSLLNEATYAGGGWLPWLSATSVDMLDWAQNRNLRVITGQLASMPNEALRVEAGVQSFGCIRDCAAAVALEKSLRLDPAAHPRAAKADSGVTQRFKGDADGQPMGKEVISCVGEGLDTHIQLALPAPTSTPWEWEKGCWTVSLSLRSGSGPNEASRCAGHHPVLRPAMDSHLHRWLSCGWS